MSATALPALTPVISARRGITNGLIAGAVIVFLILIGIPGATGSEALPDWIIWTLFILIALAFGFVAARARNLSERRAQTLSTAAAAGLVTGLLAAAVVVIVMLLINAAQIWELGVTRESLALPSGLRSNIARVQDVLANVTARTTAVMAGLPLEAIRPADASVPRADPVGGFFGMSLLLVAAGTAGGIASYVNRITADRREQRAQSQTAEQRAARIDSPLLRWLPIALPVLLFAFIVMNATLPNASGPLADAYRSFIGGSRQLVGLLAAFFMIGAGLNAIRAAARQPGAAAVESFAVRVVVLVGLVIAFFTVGFAAPQPVPSDLMFSQRTPNLIEVVGAEGVQVVPRSVVPIDIETLRGYRSLVIGAIGVLFAVGNVFAARSKTPLRTLLAANAALLTLVITPLYLDRYQQSVLLLVGINIMLGLGLNIVVGYVGLLDLGYVAYFAIGAYTYAFAVSNQDVRVAGRVVGLRYGGNDQWVQGIAAAFVMALIVAPIVIGLGTMFFKRRAEARSAPAEPATAEPPRQAARPGWQALVLVAASVVAVQIVLAVVRGTAFYDTFLDFPNVIIGALLSMIVAATVGALIGIPVLRLRGDYLAIVTLGLGEITRLLFNNLRTLTGGPQGVEAIPRISIGPLEMGSNEGMLYLTLALCVLIAFIALRLKTSRVGRAWGAVKSDEDIAQAMGINPFRVKVFAYAFSAALAGLGGVIFASRQVSIYPDNFTLLVSINVLSVVIIGGMGSVPGVIVGALVLIGIPEALRVFESYRVMIFGALLVVMMLLRPAGILPEPPYPLAARARALAQKEGQA